MAGKGAKGSHKPPFSVTNTKGDTKGGACNFSLDRLVYKAYLESVHEPRRSN